MHRLILALLLAACSPSAARGQENILLVVADDVGIDRIGCYEEHPSPGNTPNIDSLARRGVLFRNAWAYPLCSPTRAALLTGRYGFRNGIGVGIRKIAGNFSLPLSEVTTPELLRDHSPHEYRSMAIGKWHLCGPDPGPGHPQASGFDHFRGALSNLPRSGGYRARTKIVDGQVTKSTTYATTDAVDDAIGAIEKLAEPWFIMLAFHAAHPPYHAPPSHLHTVPLAGKPAADPINHHKAMVEALDTELGRLLNSMDANMRERTNVIFFGDNGTPGEATELPFDGTHAKGSPYEGGLHVPLIISGPRVARPASECQALVHAVDLFTTIGDMADIPCESLLPDGKSIDSVSLLPYLAAPDRPGIRRTIFAERFNPNGSAKRRVFSRAIRNQRYKLIRFETREEFYDLASDPFETTDLYDHPALMSPSVRAAYLDLAGQLASILNS